MNEKNIINNEYDYSNIIPLVDYIIYLINYCDDYLKHFKRLMLEDEQKNKALKYEYKNYTFKACYGDRLDINISCKNYNTITCKDIESFRSAVNNGNLNNISKLKIILDLDYERGMQINREKHENSFQIIFEPYNVKFNRKSNYKDSMMDIVERDINEILSKFPTIDTIFCTKGTTVMNQDKKNINLQQITSDMARIMNYKLHAQCLSIPILSGFSEQENDDPQTILIATKDEITEQLVSDGYIGKNEFEKRIELVIKNCKEWMKKEEFDGVDNSFIYYKDYDNGIFHFKLYFQDMIFTKEFDKHVIRNLIAYFVEPRMQDFYQFQIGVHLKNTLAELKVGVIDLENDQITKTLDRMMKKLLDDFKYKDSIENKLKRKDIANEIYNYKTNKFNMDNYVNEILSIIEKNIYNSNFEYDEDFIFGGRKKFLYDEFNECLDKNVNSKIEDPIMFAVRNLEEFICNDNYGSFIEFISENKTIDKNKIDGKSIARLREKNDRYSSKGYICLQEKEYIENMLKKLRRKIKR